MAFDMFGQSEMSSRQSSAGDYGVSATGHIVSPTLGNSFIVGGNQSSAGGAGTALGAAAAGPGAAFPWSTIVGGGIVIALLSIVAIWLFNRKK